MGAYQDWQWATETLATARNKSAGKPVQNNTRLFQRSDDSIAVKLHAVDVVTINRDGTWTLRAEGWHTVTTMERIRGYSPAKLFSERGEWFLRLEPNPDDPHPARYDRTVPKPYTATDPGDEPVKSELGCQAGSMIGTDHVNERIEIWRRDMQDGDEFVEVVSEYDRSSDYDKVAVLRTWTSWIFYGEDQYNYNNAEWTAAKADHTNVTYEQCPHCKAFDAEHERWRYGMYGERWGRRFDGQTGFATYREMMATYGTQEAWQEAYIEDFRARRAYLKAEKEWDERNRIPFYDGVTVDSDGYAPRLRKDGPSPAKLRRHEAAVKKMKKRIDKYVDGFIAELKKGTMPMPGNGDCWYCLFRNTEDGNETMGDIAGSDHLLSHMEERYYVPMLAVNALRERGYQDTGVYIWLDMNQDAGTMGSPNGRYDGVKRDLVKYMSKRLIPQAPTT